MLRLRAPLARAAASLLVRPFPVARACLLAPPLRNLSAAAAAAAAALAPVTLPVDTVFDFKTVESQWQRVWGVAQPSCYSSELAKPTEYDSAPPVPAPGKGEYFPALPVDRLSASVSAPTAPSEDTDMSKRPAFYSLSMFPYPSGSLHMGHVRVYSMSDTLARYHSLRGFRVLHPMGWDAFGLPAENAAIERGVSPEQWTYSNIQAMRSQLNSLGLKFDWDREIATCHPDYYRWTQWLFLRLHAAGLAYRTNAVVNWDPVDNTVLANEQVDAAGRSWRSGAVVERRPLEQWFFRLTALADELADGVEGLDGWPGAVRVLQKQWIGRRNHARVVFPLAEATNKAMGVTRTPSSVSASSEKESAAAAATSATEDQDLLVTVTTEASAPSDDADSSAAAEAEGAAATAADAAGGASEKVESSSEVLDLVNGLEAFTTRPETLFGVSYVALAPAGPVAAALVARAVAKGLEGAGEAAAFCQSWGDRTASAAAATAAAGAGAGAPEGSSASAPPSQTGGMLLPWLTVTHPLTQTPLPVYLADYARPGKGTGVVMGVPAHDVNDYAFAEAHGLAAPVVVLEPGSAATAAAGAGSKEKKAKGHAQADAGSDVSSYSSSNTPSAPYTSRSGVLTNSGPYTGMDTDAAATAISRALATLSPRPLGRPTPSFHVRDWLVSRQRFWGTPIPIIHCLSSCGPVPVPEDQLPVTLPRGLPLTGRGPSPLASDHPVAKQWREDVTCPCCGGPGRRETDTLDTFIDSSWYFLRYLCPPGERAQHAWSPAEAGALFPVTQYVGGVEHAILHLLYARFLTRVLHHQGLVSDPEPFAALLTQGMVHGESFRHPATGRFVPKTRVVVTKDAATGGDVAWGFETEEAAAAAAAAVAAAAAPGTEAGAGVEAALEGGERLDIVWEKMSKSKHNGVDPVAIVNRFGADVSRLFILFKAPPEKVLDWDERTVLGTLRWVNRLWVLVTALERAAAARTAAKLPPMATDAARVFATLAAAAEKAGGEDAVVAAAAAKQGVWRGRAEAQGAPEGAVAGILALPASTVTAAATAANAAAGASEGAVLSAGEVAVLNACAAAATGVTKALDSRHFNVAISHLMTLSNELTAFLAPSTAAPANPGEASQTVYDAGRLASPVVGEAACLLFQLLAPMAPHFAAEAYARTKMAIHGLPAPAPAPSSSTGNDVSSKGDDASVPKGGDDLPSDSPAAFAAAGAAYFDCHAQPWPLSPPPPTGTAAAAVAAWGTLPRAVTADALPGWRKMEAVCVVQVNGKKLAAIPVDGALLEPPLSLSSSTTSTTTTAAAAAAADGDAVGNNAADLDPEWFFNAIASDADFLTSLADALRTGNKSLCSAAAPGGVPAQGVRVRAWAELGVKAKKVVAKVTRPGHTAMVSIVV